MALAKQFVAQPLAPVLFVAVGAGEVELPLTLIIKGAAGIEMRLCRAIDLDLDRLIEPN